jgi:hypothetical protein
VAKGSLWGLSLKTNNHQRFFFIIVVLAIIIKLSLFVFATMTAPQGKLLPDSHGYLKLSEMLSSKGVFASQDSSGNLIFETFRTPGYPLFLAVFHGLMKIPLDGIILIQIAMTLLTAFTIYKTALIVEPKIAFLSTAIILLDPPITIFSMTILTESLFLLLISIFMYLFVLYLKTTNSRAPLKVPYYYLSLSALVLVAAAYVRPIGYYLGLIVAPFIFYVNKRENLTRSITHAIIFLAVTYGLLFVWQYRNYVMCGDFAFSSVEKADLSSMGLFKSYARNADIHTKGMAPLTYYVNTSFRCLMSIMTRPGNFKYFQCEPLNLGSFVFSYPWMIFWLSGFILGLINLKRNKFFQFMGLAIFYFTATSIIGVMWCVGERFRVPIMPFIAIISAYGWTIFIDAFRHKYFVADCARKPFT